MESTDFVKLFLAAVTLFVLYKFVYRYAFSRKAKEIEAPKNGPSKANINSFWGYVDNFIGKLWQDDEETVYTNVPLKSALPVIPVFFACDNNYFPYPLTNLLSDINNEISHTARGTYHFQDR